MTFPAAALREYGFHTGYDCDRVSGFSDGLAKVFAETGDDATMREKRLREWIKRIQWEVASDPRLICTVWHPQADPLSVDNVRNLAHIF